MIRRFAWSLLLVVSVLVACSDSANTSPDALLAYDADPRAVQIGQRIKTVETAAGTRNDRVFVDGLGREAYFRGFNVSGSVKHVSKGFLPYLDDDDARFGFDLLARNVGANVVRFTLSWEGVQPQPGDEGIDYAYLEKMTAQIRQAVRNRMYVFLDYHWDIYTRHLFAPDSTYAGNGAPAWVTPIDLYGEAQCFDTMIPVPDLILLLDGFGLPLAELEALLGLPLQDLLLTLVPDIAGLLPLPFALPLCFSWSQYLLTSGSIRQAYYDFWINAEVPTDNGPVYVQDEFLRQLAATADYLREHLTDEEFDYVLGLQPMNEPYFGSGHSRNADTFDNDFLWPFYRRVKAVLEAQGWGDKPAYVEPQVTWDTNAGITPATGGGYLEGERPGADFVFAPHFYDAGRFGVNLTAIDNGAYLRNLDVIRDETRFLDTPVMLGEFGAPLYRTASDGVTQLDSIRSVKSVYQALELSDAAQEDKTRYADFYTAPISSTQWEWDIYYDQHAEPRNGLDESDILSDDDAWNGEDFSVLGILHDFSTQAAPSASDAGVDALVQYNLAQTVVERAYPRRLQGELMSFHYNDAALDQSGERIDWVQLKPDDAEALFVENKWLMVIWRGRTSEAPTELFLPRHLVPDHLLVMTEDALVADGLAPGQLFAEGKTQALLVNDPDRAVGSGHRLLIANADPSADDIHFALVVDADGEDVDVTALAALRQALVERVVMQQQSPFYFAGKMTDASQYR